MPRALALLLIFVAAGLSARGQAPAPRDSIVLETKQDEARVRQAISSLKLLESEVIVYKSLAGFEEGRALSRVSFETFQRDLQRISPELESIQSELPENRLKTELGNALSCYQDGAFWWAKIFQPRMVNVSTWPPEIIFSSVDATYKSSIPYTVAINWREASRHLRRAEALNIHTDSNAALLQRRK